MISGPSLLGLFAFRENSHTASSSKQLAQIPGSERAASYLLEAVHYHERSPPLDAYS